MVRRIAIQLWIPLSLLLLSTAVTAQTGNTAVINNERVNIRSGPGEQFNRFTLLDKESRVTEVNHQNGWSQIRLSDGRTGWLHDRYLRYLNKPKPAATTTPTKTAQRPAQKPTQQPVKVAEQPKVAPRPAHKSEPRNESRRQARREARHEAVHAAAKPAIQPVKSVVQTSAPKSGPQTTAKAPTQQPAATATVKPQATSVPVAAAAAGTRGTAGTKSAPATGTAKATAAATKPNNPTTQRPNNPTTQKATDPNAITGLLVDTKKDPFASGTGVGVGVGDAFRLLLYLLPVLGLVVLAVRGLKRFQEKTGTLPSFKGSILGGFNLSNSRKVGGSNIRVVESVPVGAMELHVVEVRGRMLLLSSSGQSVTLLTELSDGETGQSDFQALLGSLADGDVDDEDLDSTIGVTVGSLDDSLRETREAIVRSAQKTLDSRASGALEDEGNIDDQLFGRRKAGGRR